jgi:hypothetical protein
MVPEQRRHAAESQGGGPVDRPRYICQGHPMRTQNVKNLDRVWPVADGPKRDLELAPHHSKNAHVCPILK